VGAQEQAAEAVREALTSAGLAYEQPARHTYVVTLPGERKLQTTCSLVVGVHRLTLNAFVARHPDENAEEVYRWLLQRNVRTAGVAFAVDALGDIYLVGGLPVAAVTAEEVDALLGSVLTLADGSFNPILEMGFASAIRREWAWRTSRGEPTANLAAFAHLVGPSDDPARS
jgi:hypothetical protein